MSRRYRHSTCSINLSNPGLVEKILSLLFHCSQLQHILSAENGAGLCSGYGINHFPVLLSEAETANNLFSQLFNLRNGLSPNIKRPCIWLQGLLDNFHSDNPIWFVVIYQTHLELHQRKHTRTLFDFNVQTNLMCPLLIL